MNQPIVLSIIIPVYNTGIFLEYCLVSIKKAGFTLPYEIVLVNDGSTDSKTLEILNKYESEFKVIHQENGGAAKARNTAIKNAIGEYILPFDSDDLMIPENYNQLLKQIVNDHSIDVIYGDYINMGDKNTYSKSNDFSELKLLLGSNFISCSNIYKRTVWEKINGYNENYRINEDYDFWSKAVVEKFKFKYAQLPLFYYRRIFNGESVSQKQPSKYVEVKQDVINNVPRSVFTVHSINNYVLTSLKNNNKLKLKLILILFFPAIFNLLKKKGYFKNDLILD